MSWDFGMDKCLCEGPAILEVKPRQKGWSFPYPNKSMYQPYQGQLKLEIEAKQNQLIVHIDQGRHLSTKYNAKCYSYVRVALVTGKKTRNGRKTEVIPSTHDPLYDQGFIFNVTASDYEKRIYISVWHRNNRLLSRKDELLGCMSFGIMPLLRKTKEVNGWYYLLAPELGATKHLAVSQRDHNSSSDSLHSHHKVILRQDDLSFGFTVCGSSPVVIGRVYRGSPAEDAGLQRGDHIISVNGQHVSNCPASKVAKCIRSSEGLTLEVLRALPMVPAKPKRVTFLANYGEL